MELTLKGKTALVTGGSRGIGLGMADRFLERRRQRDDQLPDGRGDLAEADGVAGARRASEERVAWNAAHVGDPEDAQAASPRRWQRFGGIDILVNNAGHQPVFRSDDRHRRGPSAEDVRGRTSCRSWSGPRPPSKAGLRGSIINVASVGGLEVEPGIGWYNVTKAAVLHITRQLSFELAPDIRVNALAPGLVKTKLAAALWEGPGEDRIAGHIPLRRLGVPDDIATAALFLASDAASWVTGQTLRRGRRDHGPAFGRRGLSRQAAVTFHRRGTPV